MKFTIAGGATVDFDPNIILGAHENTKKNWINVFTHFGEIIIQEAQILPYLQNLNTAYTRFNPSTEANIAGIATMWEDGERFSVWYHSSCPIINDGEFIGVVMPGKRLRIEF